jgi:hypothetical protein
MIPVVLRAGSGGQSRLMMVAMELVWAARKPNPGPGGSVHGSVPAAGGGAAFLRPG